MPRPWTSLSRPGRRDTPLKRRSQKPAVCAGKCERGLGYSGLWMTRTELSKWEIGGGGDGAGEVAEEAAALVGADHDQAAGVLLGDLDEALPGGRRFDRQRLGAEARLLGELGAVGGGFLRRLLDLVGRGRVELAAFDRHEADVGGLPDADDERLAAGRELDARLLDRVAGEVGAVVGEDRRGRRASQGDGGALDASMISQLLRSRPVPRPGRSRRRASSGGDVVGGALAGEEALEVRRLRAGAAEPVERRPGTTPPRSARAKPIQSAMPTPWLRPPPTFSGEVGEDRRDHERGDGAQELDDREDALQVRRPQREAGDEQGRGDGGAEADAGEEGADQGQCLRSRAPRSGRPGCRRRGRPCRPAAGSGARASVITWPRANAVMHRAAELGQVEQAEVERAVLVRRAPRGQRRGRDRGRGGEQGERRCRRPGSTMVSMLRIVSSGFFAVAW